MNDSIYNYDPNKKYLFGCVITLYNREKLIANTIDSINRSFLPNNILFIIINDGSKNLNINLDVKFDYIYLKKEKNYGVDNSLTVGWDILYSLGVEFMINLDSDVEVSSNWLSVLNNIFQFAENNRCIITGYNGSFPDGIINHNIVSVNKNYKIKNSIGGINLFFHRDIYKNILRKALTDFNYIGKTIEDIVPYWHKYTKSQIRCKNGLIGWDWKLSDLCKQYNISILSPHKSVVQHLGFIGISSYPSYFEQSYDYSTECVPKIIHQLWKDNNIPEHLLMMQKSVKNNHQDYKYMFWTDSTLDDFIKKYYPGIWDFYDSGLEYIIQKIDFIRLLLIYHYGGVYLDLDSLAVKNTDSILKYPCSFINTKKHDSFLDSKYTFIINNAFIAAEPRNNFIRKIMMDIINYKDPDNYKDYCSFNPTYTKILKSAGPLCVTDSYLSYLYRNLVNLLPNSYYYGLDYSKDMSPSEIINYGLNFSHSIEDCHFIHLHESSWWRVGNKAIDPVLNPNFQLGKQSTDSIKKQAIEELLNQESR